MGREQAQPVVAGVAAAAFAGWAVSLVTVMPARRDWPYPSWILVITHLIGFLFLAVGLFVWTRQSNGSRMGPLLVAVGATWHVGDLQFSENDAVFTLGFWLYHLNVVILAHLLLAYPTGRLPGRSERITIGTLYVTTLVTQGLRAATEHPLQPQGWGDPNADYSVWAPIGSVVALLAAVAVMVLVVRRWRAEPRPLRRTRTLFWAAVALTGVVVSAGTITAILHAPIAVQGALLFGYALAQLLLGVAVVLGALREQFAHRRISQFAADLAQPRTADLESLRDRLATVLEDPGLTLHYRRRNADGTTDYVDLHGRPAPLPPESDDRMVTYVGPDREPLAALVHTRVPAQERQHAERLTAVTNIAGLALENAGLHAAQQAHLREVVKIEEAAERATMKRIEATLHDGAQHRLSAVQFLLGMVQSQHRDEGLRNELRPVAEELQGVVDDLRALAQGIYPAALQGGLAAGLAPLAQRSPVPLTLDVPPRLHCERLRETMYFLISEAVGNAWKHADATAITVRVWESDDQIGIEITDDGRGSAAPSPDGSGLRRWRDRVSALGGTFRLHSPPGGGTSLKVVLPCE